MLPGKTKKSWGSHFNGNQIRFLIILIKHQMQEGKMVKYESQRDSKQ